MIFTKTAATALALMVVSSMAERTPTSSGREPRTANGQIVTGGSSISMRTSRAGGHADGKHNHQVVAATSSSMRIKASGRDAASNAESSSLRTHATGRQASNNDSTSFRTKISRVESSGRTSSRHHAKPDATGSVDEQRDLMEARIVGGEQASPGEFPFYIQWNGGFEGTCGASLIHPDVMLTAAHCGLDSNDVWVGAYESTSEDHGTEKRRIIQRSRHPQYNDDTLEFDFEVMKLDAPVTTIPPIALNPNGGTPADGEMLTVVGLGDTTDGGSAAQFLQKVDVPKVADTKCNNQLSSFGGINENVMFCAGRDEGGVDSCQQDSGGPIFSMVSGSPVQVGVVSWGIGCALRNRPGVYARISDQYGWIQQQICDLSSNPPASCNGGGGDDPTPAPVPTPTPTPTPNDGGCVELKVEITTDAYGGDNSFVVYDENGVSVLEGDGFGDSATEELVTCVDPNACYTLEVSDSFEDGMCCEYGSGGYRAYLDGTEVASGGDFDTPTDQRTIGSCDSGSDGDLTSTELVIEFQTDSYAGESSFFVRDLQTNQKIFRRGPKSLNDDTSHEFKVDIDPDLCYELRIKDSYGDGICCSEGNGVFKARVGDITVAEFGEFESFDKIFFGNSCNSDA